MPERNIYFIIKTPGKLPNLQIYTLNIADVELMRIGMIVQS